MLDFSSYLEKVAAGITVALLTPLIAYRKAIISKFIPSKYDYEFEKIEQIWTFILSEDVDYFDVDVNQKRKLHYLKDGVSYWEYFHEKKDGSHAINDKISKTFFQEYSNRSTEGTIESSQFLAKDKNKISFRFVFSPPTQKNERINLNYTVEYPKFKCATRSSFEKKREKLSVDQAKPYERIALRITRPTNFVDLTYKIPFDSKVKVHGLKIYNETHSEYKNAKYTYKTESRYTIYNIKINNPRIRSIIQFEYFPAEETV